MARKVNFKMLAEVFMNESAPDNPPFRRAEKLLGRRLTLAERVVFREAWKRETWRYFGYGSEAPGARSGLAGGSRQGGAGCCVSQRRT